MKTLSLEITKKGMTYRQMRREGMVALYSQHLKGRVGKPLAYEVIVIKTHGEYTIAGNTIEAGESYPGDEAFGILGWSYSTLMPQAEQIALDKWTQVVEAEGEKAKTRAARAHEASSLIHSNSTDS